MGTKTVPSDFRDENIVTTFKHGEREICSNYCGISLLSIASKIFCSILLDPLLTPTEDALPASPCDFRSSLSTVNMILCARQLQEKSQEQQQPLMFIFWDLKKAFDKVPRPAMCAVLASFGCPDDFINLIRALHDDMVGRVCHRSTLSDPFLITGGLKQECVLAPTFFSLYVTAMLNEVPPKALALIYDTVWTEGFLILLASVQNTKHLSSQPISCNLPMTMLPQLRPLTTFIG